MGETASAVIGVRGEKARNGSSHLPRVCRYHGLATTLSENSPAFCALAR